MKRTYHMSMLYEGITALIVKAEWGTNVCLEGYILTDRHSGTPIVEHDGFVPDFRGFERDVIALLQGHHILEVSTTKFYAADLFTQERIVAELIKAVVYDTKRGII